MRRVRQQGTRRLLLSYKETNKNGRHCLSPPIYADLATERERHLTTGKCAERTKLDFRCPICGSAIGQASCWIWARRRQLTFPFCC